MCIRDRKEIVLLKERLEVAESGLELVKALEMLEMTQRRYLAFLKGVRRRRRTTRPIAKISQDAGKTYRKSEICIRDRDQIDAIGSFDFEGMQGIAPMRCQPFSAVYRDDTRLGRSVQSDSFEIKSVCAKLFVTALALYQERRLRDSCTFLEGEGGSRSLDDFSLLHSDREDGGVASLGEGRCAFIDTHLACHAHTHVCISNGRSIVFTCVCFH